MGLRLDRFDFCCYFAVLFEVILKSFKFAQNFLSKNWQTVIMVFGNLRNDKISFILNQKLILILQADIFLQKEKHGNITSKKIYLLFCVMLLFQALSRLYYLIKYVILLHKILHLPNWIFVSVHPTKLENRRTTIWQF